MSRKRLQNTRLPIPKEGEILRPSERSPGELPIEPSRDNSDPGKGRTKTACALCPKFDVPGPGIGCLDCEAME